MRKQFNPSGQRRTDQRIDSESDTSVSSDVNKPEDTDNHMINDLTDSTPSGSEQNNDSRREKNASIDLNKLFGKAPKTKTSSEAMQAKKPMKPTRTQMAKTAESDSTSEEDSDDATLKATKQSSRSQNTTGYRRRQVSDNDNPFAKLVAEVSKSTVAKSKKEVSSLMRNKSTHGKYASNRKAGVATNAAETDTSKNAEKGTRRREIPEDDMPIRELFAHNSDSDDDDELDPDENLYMQLVPQSLRTDMQPKPGTRGKPAAGGAPGAPGGGGVFGTAFGLPGNTDESSGAQRSGAADLTPEQLEETMAEIEELLKNHRKGKKRTKRDEEDDKLMEDVLRLMQEHPPVPADQRPDRALLGPETDRLREQLMAGLGQGEEQGQAGQGDDGQQMAYSMQRSMQEMGGSGGDQAYQLQQMMGGLGGDQANQLRQMMGGLGGDQANQLRQMMGGQGGDQVNQLRQMMGGLGGDQGNQRMQGALGRGGDRVDQIGQLGGLGGLGRGRGMGEGHIGGDGEEDINIADPGEGEIMNQLLAMESIKAQNNNAPKAQEGMSTIIILDTSNSMAGDGIVQATQFLTEFLDGLQQIRHAANLDENVALITIGESVEVAQHLTNDFSKIRAILHGIYTNGPTKLQQALVLPICIFPSAPNHGIQNYGSHVAAPRVILISDGRLSIRPDDSQQSQEENLLTNEALKTITSSTEMTMCQLTCIPVGNCSRDFLSLLAQSTGGQMYERSKAKQLSHWNMYHYIVAMLKQQGQAEPTRDSIQQVISSRIGQCNGSDVDEVLAIWRQPEPDLAAFQLRLQERAAGGQQSEEGMGAQGMVASGIGDMPMMGGGRGLSAGGQGMGAPGIGGMPMMGGGRGISAGGQGMGAPGIGGMPMMGGGRGISAGGQGIGASGIGGMPMMGGGRGMTPTIYYDQSTGTGRIPTGDRGLATPELSRGSERAQTGNQIPLRQEERGESSQSLPAAGRGVDGKPSEGNGKARPRTVNNDRDDGFNIGMRDMFHMNDYAVAQRRRRLEKERAELDKLPKLPAEQLRLEKLPDPGNAQWPSKEQLRPSHRLEREVTTTRLVSEIPRPTKANQRAERKDQPKPGWRIRHQDNQSQTQDHRGPKQNAARSDSSESD